jgi:hypothetical protein
MKDEGEEKTQKSEKFEQWNGISQKSPDSTLGPELKPNPN